MGGRSGVFVFCFFGVLQRDTRACFLSKQTGEDWDKESDDLLGSTSGEELFALGRLSVVCT